MSITFACPCGKTLKAQTAFAGRRTRCTRCGTVLIIPHADADVGSVSETELLAPMDFADVEVVVKTPRAAEPSPVEALGLAAGEEIQAESGPGWPVTVREPPGGPSPGLTTPRGPKRSSSALVEWLAYGCITVGFAQFVVVLLALASGVLASGAVMFLLSLLGALVAPGLGSLILLTLDLARRLAEPR